MCHHFFPSPFLFASLFWDTLETKEPSKVSSEAGNSRHFQPKSPRHKMVSPTTSKTFLTVFRRSRQNRGIFVQKMGHSNISAFRLQWIYLLHIFFWQKKQWTRIIYLFSMKMDSGWFPKKKRGKYEKKLTEKLQFFKKNVILGSISSPKGSRHHRRRQSSNSKDHHLKQLAEPKTSANGFIHSSINLSVSLGSQSSQMNSYYS